MKLYSIASGSSGNSIFIGSEGNSGGILVDTGISKKRIEEGLAAEHVTMDHIDRKSVV